MTGVPFANPWLVGTACAVAGLAFGSFLNVVIYRLPRILMRNWTRDAAELVTDPAVRLEIAVADDDARILDSAAAVLAQRLEALAPLGISRPRSHCRTCQATIAARHNLPIIGWLVLRGRCATCHAPISARYPVVEAVTAFLWGAAGWQFGFGVSLIAALALIGMLVAMTLIDADTLLLPDGLTLPLLWLGLIFNSVGGFVPIRDAVVGAIAGYLLFWSVANLFRMLRGIEGMGAGDYKLLAALGAWFGWGAILPIVLLAAGVGSVVGITLIVSRRATLLTRLPFGVYLAPAGIVMLFFGTDVTAFIMPGGH